nr:uncharacterized protein LOC122274102 [Parasteatoda tepidariorum]
MELSFVSPARCELRSLINFLSAKNVPPVDIHSKLCEVYGEKCMNVQHVCKWCGDEQRSGRASFSDKAIAKVEEAMLKDRRVTVRNLSEMIPDVSESCIHNILSDRLGYAKVCARWIPKMLTDDNKRQRPHTARATNVLINRFGWNTVTHPLTAQTCPPVIIASSLN